MSKNWLKKFNKSALKKKTPLLGFTVLELFILFVVISGGTTAIVVNRYQQTPKQDTSANLPTYETNNSGQSTIKIAEPDQTAPTDTAPNNSQNNAQQKPTNTAPSSSNNTGHLDEWGCYVPAMTPSTDMSNYYQCIRTKKALWCNDQISSPASTFNTAVLQARAAYNSVMNEWEIAQYQTPHNPKSEYLADATAKFNAIYNPAYSTYFTKVQSLNSQGCSLQYPSHESAGQYW